MLDPEFMKNRIKEINEKALVENDESKLKKLIDEKLMWQKIYDSLLKNSNKKMIIEMSNRKEIYIFDIDGCIMPSIFPNIYDPNQNREQIIREVNEEGRDIRLFPEFIKFYKNICKKALLVFFITGRQQKVFGELTECQLKKLRKFKHYFIIFYPEEYPHIPKTYFQWKIEMITCIFRVFQNSEGIIFRIFDDMGDYFKEIKVIANSLNLKQKCYFINDDILWDILTEKLM